MLKIWLRYLPAFSCFRHWPWRSAVAAGGARDLTGKVTQSDGVNGFSVVRTISANAAETDYPEIKCSGKLRASRANGYVFSPRPSPRGSKSSGGDCLDGTITVAPASDKLIWVWAGSSNNEALVAWATLVRK